MTIDEKLQHFMDVTTEKVNAENAKQMNMSRDWKRSMRITKRRPCANPSLH